MKQKIKIGIKDVEAIEPGHAESFKLPTGLACNAAKTMVDYARKTRGMKLRYACDWRTFTVKITRLW